MLTSDGFDHLVLTVLSIEHACRFYEKLGMERVQFGSGRVAVAFSTSSHQRINFHEVGHVIHPRAARATVGSGDFCLVVSQDMPTIIAHLLAQNIPIEAGPVPRNGSRGPMHSVYIRDPDKNLVELATYTFTP